MGVPSEGGSTVLLFKVDSEATSCADQRDNVKLRVRQAGGKGIELRGQAKALIEHLEHPSITELLRKGRPLWGGQLLDK